LSEGATSTSWQALDTALGRTVRLEMLRADRLDDAEGFRQRTREAARAQSPRVLDGGDDPDTQLPFVVYEQPDLPPAVPEAQPTQPLERPVALPAHTKERPTAPPTRSRVRPRQRGLGWERVALGVLLVIPMLLGVALIANWLAQPTSPAAQVFSLPQPTEAPPAAPKPTAAPAPTAAATKPTAAAKPTATPVTGERRRVANTDGLGVALRDGPDGQRLPGRGYDEGATVTLLEQQGRWSKIRGDDGREGWVLSVTLVR
jgi:hypothetical protein